MKGYAILLALAATLANPSWGQESEPLWRTLNNAPAKIVPLYNGGISPFPQVEHTSQLTDEALRQAEQERLKTETISRAQQTISGAEGIVPDVDNIDFQGFIEAQGGGRVLYRNTWLKAGDKFMVHARQSTLASQALEEVKGFDQNAAQAMEGSLKTRLEQNGFVPATIQKISSQTVIIQTQGQAYTIRLPHGNL